MTDNYFVGLPAMMNYASPEMTDYRSATTREHSNKQVNGIVRDDDYREFLINNTNVILGRVRAQQRAKFGGFANTCVFNYPTRTLPSLMYDEMQLYNAQQTGKIPATRLKCNPPIDLVSTYP